MVPERRSDDQRIDEIHQDIKDIKQILQGERGLCVRVAVVERSNEATQKELVDHKKSHWAFATIVVGLAGIVAGAIKKIGG